MHTNSFSRATKRVTVVAGAAAVLFATAACSAGGAGEGAEAPYKIGVPVGITGAYATLGEEEQKAAELYFKEHPEINGHPVELVTLDSESDEGAAVNQYRKLAVEEQVHAVIGPSSSGEGMALRTFSRDLMTPTIVLAATNEIVVPPAEATYHFKQYTGTSYSLQAQLEYAKDQGWDKAALLYTNDGYGQVTAEIIGDIADDAGVEVAGMEPFDGEATDVTAQLGKIANEDADVLLVWAGNSSSQAVVAKSASSIDFEPQIFTSPGAGSFDYINSGGESVEGALVQGSVVLAPESISEDDPLYDATNELVTAYDEAYGAPAGQFAGNAWDGATLVANAIENAAEHDPADIQVTRDAIRDSLENNTTDIPGVNAIYTFTPEFHGVEGLSGLAVLEVVDGKYEVVKTYK